MNKTFILIGIFLVIVYVYLYTKTKKTKERTRNIDSVRDFNNSYKHLRQTPNTKNSNSGSRYNSYITKYNSSEDYREKH